MDVVIFGGGGFLGKKLALELRNRGALPVNGDLKQPIDKIIVFDKTIDQSDLDDPIFENIEGDICDKELIRSILESKPAVIFHLAAIVSGEAEKNFDIGLNVNLLATLDMLEICRELDYQPVVVFASSCAVFGEAPGTVILDRTASFPKSSYGTQKAIVDLLINDYSRKQFIDGRALRLPTIVVRPGKPNAATTSFVSSIIREPLQGSRANCPVDASAEVWILSPSKVVDNFIHAAAIPRTALGDNRTINLPGMTITIQKMVDDLESVAGPEAIQLITWEPDDFLQQIVPTFPTTFETEKALRLGFQKDNTFTDIIREFIDSELKS